MLSNSWVVDDFYPIDFIPAGVRLSSSFGGANDLPADVLEYYLDAAARDHGLIPLDRGFPIEQIAAAHEYMEQDPPPARSCSSPEVAAAASTGGVRRSGQLDPSTSRRAAQGQGVRDARWSTRRGALDSCLRVQHAGAVGPVLDTHEPEDEPKAGRDWDGAEERTSSSPLSSHGGTVEAHAVGGHWCPLVWHVVGRTRCTLAGGWCRCRSELCCAGADRLCKQGLRVRVPFPDQRRSCSKPLSRAAIEHAQQRWWSDGRGHGRS